MTTALALPFVAAPPGSGPGREVQKPAARAALCLALRLLQRVQAFAFLKGWEHIVSLGPSSMRAQGLSILSVLCLAFRPRACLCVFSRLVTLIRLSRPCHAPCHLWRCLSTTRCLISNLQHRRRMSARADLRTSHKLPASYSSPFRHAQDIRCDYRCLGHLQSVPATIAEDQRKQDHVSCLRHGSRLVGSLLCSPCAPGKIGPPAELAVPGVKHGTSVSPCAG